MKRSKKRPKKLDKRRPAASDNDWHYSRGHLVHGIGPDPKPESLRRRKKQSESTPRFPYTGGNIDKSPAEDALFIEQFAHRLEKIRLEADDLGFQLRRLLTQFTREAEKVIEKFALKHKQ